MFFFKFKVLKMGEGNYSSLFRFIQMGWTGIGINHYKEYENYNAWVINMRKTLIVENNNNRMSRYTKSERKIKVAMSAMTLKFLTFYCFLDVGLKYIYYLQKGENFTIFISFNTCSILSLYFLHKSSFCFLLSNILDKVRESSFSSWLD